MSDLLDELVFTANDVRAVAGISGRQLNDWGSRGALPHSGRAGDSGWRRFDLRGLFALMVAAAFREKLGIPVEKLGYVVEQMCDEEMDYLETSASSMVSLGIAMWVATDFRGDFMLATEAEIAARWSDDYFDEEGSDAYACLRLDDLVGRLLGMEVPDALDREARTSDVLTEVRHRVGVRSPEEFDAVRAIRGGRYASIEVVGLRGSHEIITTKDPRTRTRIINSIGRGGFRRITILRPDGRTLDLAPIRGAALKESSSTSRVAYLARGASS
ncbi:MAG: hypothetical protein ACLQU9_19925 [Acidimicrobiales bacterium]